MKYLVELCSTVIVNVEVEAGSEDEAARQAIKQISSQPNPIDPDNLFVTTPWEASLVEAR